MRSPGEKSSIKHEMAAMPDEKASASSPPSSAQTVFSSTSRVGFCRRV